MRSSHVAGLPAARLLQVRAQISRAIVVSRRADQVDADGKTGDGAGILLDAPQDFFREVVERTGHKVKAGPIFVGQIFLPRNDFAAQERARERRGGSPAATSACWPRQCGSATGSSAPSPRR